MERGLGSVGCQAVSLSIQMIGQVGPRLIDRLWDCRRRLQKEGDQGKKGEHVKSLKDQD
jgi:hypothetical protein